MKYLRYIVGIAFVFVAFFGFTACGSDTSNAGSSGAANTNAESHLVPGTNRDAVVVYFSATGTTKKEAQKIAALTGADLYEIMPQQPYTSDDLNYRNESSRVTKEHNDPSVRPAIAGPDLDLSSYKTVYLGYPIWWAEAPAIVYTFAENHNFDGKTVIPFATSASSGVGSSGEHLAAAAKTGTWKTGQSLWGNESDAELQQWISSVQ